MSEEENKALVRRLVEEWQAGHQPEVAREILSDDFIDRSGPVEYGAKEAGIEWFAYMWQAFPDFSVAIKLQIAEGDMVATLKTFSGTHQGEFMGIPPTGKQVAFDVFDMLRIRDGRVVERWNVEDSAGMMRQLGVALTPGYPSPCPRESVGPTVRQDDRLDRRLPAGEAPRPMKGSRRAAA